MTWQHGRDLWELYLNSLSLESLLIHVAKQTNPALSYLQLSMCNSVQDCIQNLSMKPRRVTYAKLALLANVSV